MIPSIQVSLSGLLDERKREGYDDQRCAQQGNASVVKRETITWLENAKRDKNEKVSETMATVDRVFRGASHLSHDGLAIDTSDRTDQPFEILE